MKYREIEIPAQGRNKDYKFYGSGVSMVGGFGGGGGGGGGGGSFLDKYFSFDEENEVLIANVNLASEKEIAAYFADKTLPSIFDNIPFATSSKVGGIKAASTYQNGIRINSNGFLEIDPSYADSGVSSWSDLEGRPLWLTPTTKAAFESGHGHTWGQITSKPTSFTPSAHNHPVSDVTGLQAALNTKLDTTVFDNLEIGGRNLIIDTKKEVTNIIISGWGDYSLASTRALLSRGIVKKGDTLTLRVYLKTSTVPVRILVRIPSPSQPLRDYKGNDVPENSEGYSSVTFTVPDDATEVIAFVVMFGRYTSSSQVVYLSEMNSSPGVTYQIKDLKLELGNRATDWTPAPEDKLDVDATAYDSARLGGQLASKYPIRDVDEVITGKWSFNDNVTLRGDRNTLALYYNADGVAKSRVNEIILGRVDNFHKWRILNQSTSSWGNNPNLSFQYLGATGSTYADVLTMTYARNVGINQPNPTESLHVVGNGLFTGNVTAQKGTLSSLDVTGGIKLGSALNALIKYDAVNDVIRFNKTIVSDYDVVAYADSGQDWPSIFDAIPIASTTNKGLVQIGSGLKVSDGIVSIDGDPFNLTNYYNSTQTDALLSGKLNTSTFNARTISAGNGLTGGGALSANRTLTLGTPSTITATSTNSVTASSHTHNLDLSSATANNANRLGNVLASNYLRSDIVDKFNHLYVGYDWASKRNGIQIGVDGLNSGLSFYEPSVATSASIFRDTDSKFYVGVRGGNRDMGIAIDQNGVVSIAGNVVATQNVSILAGNGLSGGGAISANRTLTLGTPSTITDSTTNSVTSTSHTHAISLSKADIGLGNVGNYSDYARKTISESVSGNWSFSGLPTINRQGEDVQLLRFNTERPWHFRQVGSGATAGLALVSEVNAKSFQIGYFEGTVAANFFVGSNSSTVSLVPGGNGNVSIGVNTSISGKLDIRPNTNAWGNYLNIISATDATKYTSIMNDATGLKLRNFGGGHTYFRSSANSTLLFINDNGNVAIGGQNATEKLHVAGNGLFTGNVSATNGEFSGNATVAGNIFSTGSMYLRSGTSNRVVITSNPDGGLVALYGTGSSSGILLNANDGSILANGNISAQGEVTAYSSSDIRLKQNIKPIDNALDVISKLNPVSFNWNEKAVELNKSKDGNRINYGVIAQELEKVLPELVHQTNNYKSVDYPQLIMILAKGIQELKSEIEELKNK